MYKIIYGTEVSSRACVENMYSFILYLNQFDAIRIETGKSLSSEFFILEPKEFVSWKCKNSFETTCELKQPQNQKEKKKVFILSIGLGISNRSTSAPPAMTLKSRGITSFQTVSFESGGISIPSLKSESIAVMYGNPTFASTITFPIEGTKAWNSEYTVLAEKVSCFISENASSLGT